MLRSLNIFIAFTLLLFANLSTAGDLTFTGVVKGALGIQQVDVESLNVMSCEDLYVALSGLAPQATHYRFVFVNEKADLLVSGLSSFVKPIVYVTTISWHYRKVYRV